MFSWRINQSLSKAKVFEDGSYHKVPDEMWNKRYNVKKGDLIVTLYNHGQPLYVTEIHGTSFRDILQSLYNGLNDTIDNNDSEIIQEIINNFIKYDTRKKLTDKLIRGTLKVKDLLGDHVFYEGNLTRHHGICTYALGS